MVPALESFWEKRRIAMVWGMLAIVSVPIVEGATAPLPSIAFFKDEMLSFISLALICPPGLNLKGTFTELDAAVTSAGTKTAPSATSQRHFFVMSKVMMLF